MGKKRKLGKAATTCSSRWEVAADKVMNNVDLLVEILLRVPVKSLIRFKSVSKHWRELISDSNFSLKHTQCNPKLFNSAAVYMTRERVFFSLSRTGSSSSHPELSFLDGLHPNKYIYIQSSCHGLILCSFYRDRGAHYAVCNPTTQSYRSIPFNCSGMTYVDFSSLCFDPSRSPHYYVVAGRFKFYPPSRESIEIDLYQSEFASWGEQSLKLDVPLGLWGWIYNYQTFRNGAIHWISERGYHIWFDPSSKKLTGIKLPEYPKILASKKIRFWGVCDGRLFLIQAHKRCPLGFKVLEMGLDYCSWVKKYTVNLRQVVPDLDGDNLRLYERDGLGVMSIGKENIDNDALSVVLSIGGRFISYNLQSKTWTVVLLDFHDSSQTTTCGDNLFSIRSSYPFFESLSPV